MGLTCFSVGDFACLIFRNKAKNNSSNKKGALSTDDDDNIKKSSTAADKINFKEMFDFSIVKH
jgi:hypothetical protein